MIAEQFGTLESLYPGRIDLGLGRAPGTDQVTARALRRDLGSNGENFPELIDELRSYLIPPVITATFPFRFPLIPNMLLFFLPFSLSPMHPRFPINT